jgi:hypothetical protein
MPKREATPSVAVMAGSYSLIIATAQAGPVGCCVVNAIVAWACWEIALKD